MAVNEVLPLSQRQDADNHSRAHDTIQAYFKALSSLTSKIARSCLMQPHWYTASTQCEVSSFKHNKAFIMLWILLSRLVPKAQQPLYFLLFQKGETVQYNFWYLTFKRLRSPTIEPLTLGLPNIMDTAQAKDFVRRDNLLDQVFVGIIRTLTSSARRSSASGTKAGDFIRSWDGNVSWSVVGDSKASPDRFCLVTDEFLYDVYGFDLIEPSEVFFLAKKWFQWYLTQKFLDNWPQVAGVVNGISSTSTKPQKGNEYAISSLLLAIAYKLRSESISMNDILPSLYEHGLVRANLPQKARAIDLTLGIIGWMSKWMHTQIFSMGWLHRLSIHSSTK